MPAFGGDREAVVSAGDRQRRCAVPEASGGDSVYEVLALSTEAREARRVLVETGL